MKITTDLVMSHGPCSEYSEERVADILGDGMELTEVLRLDSIPITDRVWLLTRTRAIVRAKKKCSDKDWNKWADNWLDGTGRSRFSTTAADVDAAAAVYTAAAYAADAAAAAAYAVYAADAKKERQIKDALEVLELC